MDCESFARKLTAQAVAHAALRRELSDASQLAVVGIADATASYIEKIGSIAKVAAEAGGRAEANTLDVLYALRKSQGIDWRDLRTFACSDRPGTLKWYQPFSHAVPAFPVRKRSRLDATAVANEPIASKRKRAGESSTDTRMDVGGEGQDGGAPLPPHIPAFLPPFPPAQTYRHTPAPARGPHQASALRRRERVRSATQGREAFARIAAAEDEEEAAASSSAAAAEGADGAATGRSPRSSIVRSERRLHFGDLPAGGGSSWNRGPLRVDERDDALVSPLPQLKAPLPQGSLVAGTVAKTSGAFRPAGVSAWEFMDRLDKSGRILEGVPVAEMAMDGGDP